MSSTNLDSNSQGSGYECSRILKYDAEQLSRRYGLPEERAIFISSEELLYYSSRHDLFLRILLIHSCSQLCNITYNWR